jgi:hypothetical protein
MWISSHHRPSRQIASRARPSITNPTRWYARIARSLKAKTVSPTRWSPSDPKAWSTISRVASLPYPCPHASCSPMVMWNSVDPLSPSSCENAHDPISWLSARTWIPIASASGPSARIVKNRSISSGRIGPSW